MAEHRLLSATLGIMALGSWYRANHVTQLVEIDASFWPRFLFFGLVLVGLCGWRGIRFTAPMILEAIACTMVGFMIIWFLWPYLPLSDVLPVPEPRLPAGGWPLLDEEPAPRFDHYYASLCYIFALPLAVVMALVPAVFVINVVKALAVVMAMLASAIAVYHFVISP